jgi:hypothetical protein
MFTSLLESAKVRLSQATDAYSKFESTRAVYVIIIIIIIMVDMVMVI